MLEVRCSLFDFEPMWGVAPDHRAEYANILTMLVLRVVFPRGCNTPPPMDLDPMDLDPMDLDPVDLEPMDLDPMVESAVAC